MIAFFDVISTSAPHIYHSALPLSPQMSIVCKLYKQYARPLARVVRGLPLSWEPVIATVHFEDFYNEAVWSPCSKLIAAIRAQSVDILDAVTLGRLRTFEYSPKRFNRQLSFSPDSHILMLFNGGKFISWDLQTGGLLGITRSTLDRSARSTFSSTYSQDGKVVAVAHGAQQCPSVSDRNCGTFISTYILPSRTPTGPFYVTNLIHPIWTHGKYFQIATKNPGSITIQKVGFTLVDPPVEVKSFPISDEIANGEHFLFLPSLSRLAFTTGDTIQVWDVKASKLLLTSWVGQGQWPSLLDKQDLLPKYSFSSCGHFFACLDTTGVANIWKDSHAGYMLHQQVQFPPNASNSSQGPCFSPNGESIFISIHHMIYLWHTRNQVLPLPGFSTGDIFQDHFIMKFSPNERFAAFGRRRGNKVIILNLQSGNPRCVINTGMMVDTLGMNDSAVAIISREKIITWNLPGRDGAFNFSIDDGVQITILNYSPPPHHLEGQGFQSLSPDLSLVANLGGPTQAHSYCLQIHNAATGVCLATAVSDPIRRCQPIFTQDGCEVWMLFGYLGKRGWKITKNSKSGIIELKPQEEVEYLSAAFSWNSHRGYKITGDGWILSPTQKRLLWLPHHWRSGKERREWRGQFLGLLQRELSEVVILEFFE